MVGKWKLDEWMGVLEKERNWYDKCDKEEKNIIMFFGLLTYLII